MRRTCSQPAACEKDFQPPPIHQPLADRAALCIYLGPWWESGCSWCTMGPRPLASDVAGY